MSKKRRYFRYRVAEVYEADKERMEVGQTLIDTWRGKSHTYQIVEMDADADELPMKALCHITLIGEVTEPEVLAQLEKRGK